MNALDIGIPVRDSSSNPRAIAGIQVNNQAIVALTKMYQGHNARERYRIGLDI